MLELKPLAGKKEKQSWRALRIENMQKVYPIKLRQSIPRSLNTLVIQNIYRTNKLSTIFHDNAKVVNDYLADEL